MPGGCVLEFGWSWNSVVSVSVYTPPKVVKIPQLWAAIYSLHKAAPDEMEAFKVLDIQSEKERHAVLLACPLSSACPLSPSPRVCSSSCPLSRWCHPTISSSVIPFFCLQSFPASGSFSASQFCTSGGQRIGALAWILPLNTQGWFLIGLTSLIPLQSKELSRVFSSSTIHEHQFFGAQPTL